MESEGFFHFEEEKTNRGKKTRKFLAMREIREKEMELVSNWRLMGRRVNIFFSRLARYIFISILVLFVLYSSTL